MKRSLTILALLIKIHIAIAQNTGYIEGTVTDSSGKALKGVGIHILNASGARTGRGAGTRVDGSYAITGLWAGMYNVQYTYPGKSITIVHGVAVTTDDGTVVDLKLRSSSEREYDIQEYSPPALKKTPKYFRQ